MKTVIDADGNATDGLGSHIRWGNPRVLRWYWRATLVKSKRRSTWRGETAVDEHHSHGFGLAFLHFPARRKTQFSAHFSTKVEGHSCTTLVTLISSIFFRWFSGL